MMTRRLFSMLASVAVLAGLAQSADDGRNTRTSTVPPVLRHSEATDSVIVTLPGPAPEPLAIAAAAPAVAIPATAIPLDKTLDEPRPFLRRITREYPPGFEEDSPKFLQDHIGQWKEVDVRGLLGPALRRRPSLDDAGKQNGAIYAFADPTGRYKEFELDFDGATAALRTVFIYPVKLTWQACRRVYGAGVTAADAPHGRKFYSYLNRRLDVLVDAAGTVVSLGLY